LFKKKSTSNQMYATVDLGSNSFHMIVARQNDGQLHVVDRLREPVRLAAGLDAQKNITEEAQQRALACLQRFGQRLKDLPPDHVRAVGTNTLRSARNSGGFLASAEQMLGHQIEIIAGLEEARLIYLGVAHSLAADQKLRLVMDIGGGSTELIIGTGFEPKYMESLYMGCVTMSRQHFNEGKITRSRIKKASIAARMELEPSEAFFKRLGWNVAIGASGTIRAVDKVVRAAGWSSNGITVSALKTLVDALVDAGQVKNLKLEGLSTERAPVFPGGVIILLSTFEALGIERMRVSDGALREGVLYDLIGRLHDKDVRSHSTTALATRYHVDLDQAKRVAQTAKYCLEQVSSAWELNPVSARRLLDWAAQLHEIGLDVAHSQYHKHGAYISEQADLAGFSRQEQKLLSMLVRAHRRKFPVSVFKDVPDYAQYLALLLRLAVLLHRSRSVNPLPEFNLQAQKKMLTLQFPAGWLEAHPLTQADLEQEAVYLQAAGFKLEFE
jgi:exopolyphosphatase/guanosine-5'-triphosphate,3'-diphosphate pyrophosphatase